MIKNYIIFLLIILSCASGLAQTLYFVDYSSGNDDNNGTSISTPWKTIQKACNSATPNSTVMIRGGIYNEALSVNVSGTVLAPITFTSYNNEEVIIDGSSLTAGPLLRIIGKSHLTFINLIFQNLTCVDAAGVFIGNTASAASNNLTFKSITIRNIKWTSNPEAVPTSSNNAHGLIAYGDNPGINGIVIDGCNIYDNVVGFSEALTMAGNVSNFSIRNCNIHDNTNIGIGMAGNYGVCDDPLADKARFGVVMNNHCYRNVSPVSVSAGIYVDGGEDILIEKNTCYENGLGIEVGCEKNGTTLYIMARNNIIYNNRGSGMAVGGYSELTTGQVLSSTFRNNTLFHNNSLNTGAAEIALTKLSNCIFEDNLICTNNENILLVAESIVPQENNLINYNCWYTPSADPDDIHIYWGAAGFDSFAEYQMMTLLDANSIFANPYVQDDILSVPFLDLLPASSCINAGNPLLAVSDGETDINGNPRVNDVIVDIGAVEFYPQLGNAVFAEETIIQAVPNPFTRQTIIHSKNPLAGALLQLFDCTGKMIREISNLSGTEITIDRGKLENGVYLYRITERNHLLVTGKLLVN